MAFDFNKFFGSFGNSLMQMNGVQPPQQFQMQQQPMQQQQPQEQDHDILNLLKRYDNFLSSSGIY